MTKEYVNGFQKNIHNHNEKLWKKFLRRVMAVALIGIVDTEWTRWHVSTPSSIPPSNRLYNND